VTLQVWAAAAAIVAGSLLLGNAVARLGVLCRAAAPAVGLSLLILISSVAIKLPGNAGTSAVILLAVLLAAALAAMWRRGSTRFPVVPVVVICVAALGAAIPFIANGRVGLLGVSLDNDTSTHLIYAEGLRSGVSRAHYAVSSSYPLGPHSLADTLSTGLGIRLDLAFTGLQIATVLITALVAANALRNESGWKRVIVGVLAALFYLVASYYAEGSFKEPLLGLLLLAMVLHLEEAHAHWVPGSRERWTILIPVAALMAAGIYVYSYPGLAWFGLTLLIWIVAEVAARPSLLKRWRGSLHEFGPPAGVAASLFFVLLAPTAGRIVSFAGVVGTSPSGSGAIVTSSLGNLASALSPYEALGIWNNTDFRFVPANVFHAGELSALALGVLLIGLAWSLSRREFLLPAAVVACAIVYWRASHGQSIYVTAKALAIAGPVVAVTGMRGLLQSPVAAPRRWIRFGRLALAAGFVGFAIHSSYGALRSEPVWPPESAAELISLDRLTAGQTVLFLGNSDYAPWLFHDSDMSALALNTISTGEAALNPAKPNVYGTSLDFDSVASQSMNLFHWFVTTNTTYASQAPAGLRLVRRLRLYELWERVASIAPRQVLESSGAPGAILNCDTASDRALSRRRGVAAVMTAPAVVGLGGLPPGGSARVTLRLPPGRWDLSLQYESAVDLDLQGGGGHWHMPAYLDRPGPVFGFGSVVSTGAPIPFTVRAERPSAITGPNLAAMTTALVGTRSPDARTLVPLRRACGRYVDWYRLSA
jgi:hypothetical protein